MIAVANKMLSDDKIESILQVLAVAIVVIVSSIIMILVSLRDAAAHYSGVFDELLDETNTTADVYADSAYRSEESVALLQKRGFREQLQRKGCKNRNLTAREKQGNKTRAKMRSRIEHVFGVQANIAGSSIVRTIGMIRARAKIGFRNLAYNINRYGLLATTG